MVEYLLNNEILISKYLFFIIVWIFILLLTILSDSCLMFLEVIYVFDWVLLENWIPTNSWSFISCDSNIFFNLFALIFVNDKKYPSLSVYFNSILSLLINLDNLLVILFKLSV
jgi:hypothetical protein